MSIIYLQHAIGLTELFQVKRRIRIIRKVEAFRCKEVLQSNKFIIINKAMVVINQKQIQDVFESHGESSQSENQNLSSILKTTHCLTFHFPAKNKILDPILLVLQTSSSCISLSMLKVPNITWEKRQFYNLVLLVLFLIVFVLQL